MSVAPVAPLARQTRDNFREWRCTYQRLILSKHGGGYVEIACNEFLMTYGPDASGTFERQCPRCKRQITGRFVNGALQNMLV